MYKGRLFTDKKYKAYSFREVYTDALLLSGLSFETSGIWAMIPYFKTDFYLTFSDVVRSTPYLIEAPTDLGKFLRYLRNFAVPKINVDLNEIFQGYVITPSGENIPSAIFSAEPVPDPLYAKKYEFVKIIDNADGVMSLIDERKDRYEDLLTISLCVENNIIITRRNELEFYRKREMPTVAERMPTIH